MKFYVNQQDDQFVFKLTSDNGQLLAESGTFSDRDACVTAIRSVIGQLPTNSSYRISERNGKSIFEILSPTGSLLATSEEFSSSAAAQSFIDDIVEDASDEAQYSVEVVTQTATTQSQFVEIPSLTAIDYASLYDFSYQSKTNTSGFELFEVEGNNYTFLYNDANGTPLLYARKFDSSGKREKRIRQLIQAAAKEERFEIIEENGSYFFIIKAKNNAEIGRSRLFTSQNDAEMGVQYCKDTLGNFAADYPEPAKRKKKSNEYNFDLKAESNENGFHTLRGENKEHYFVYNDAAGIPVLFSQGYSSSGGRDNGIKTVIKNAGLADQHEVKEENGSYYFILRSANRQEIARSRAFNSMEEATSNLNWTLENAKTFAGKYGVEVETVKITTETENFTIDVDLPKPAPVAVQEETVSNRNEDEYLDCEAYLGHTEIPAEGFRTFEENGQYYFVMLDSAGKVLLRSEGYPTVGARDNGLASVQKNREIKERYSVVEDGGEYFVVLKAGNHKEIARSCAFQSESAAFGTYGFLNGGGDLFPWSLPIAAAVAETIKTEAVHDNYLACKAYSGHEESPEEGFLTFKNEEDGQYYFAMFDEFSNKTLLRSEGYPTTAPRDNGIQSVIKNRDIAERYSFIEEDNQHFVILKAGNHKEIARSCGYKSKDELLGLFPFMGDSSAGFPWKVAALAATGVATIAPLTADATEPEPVALPIEEKQPIAEMLPEPEPIVEPEEESSTPILAAAVGATALAANASSKEEPIVDPEEESSTPILADAVGATALVANASSKEEPIVEKIEAKPIAATETISYADNEVASAGGFKLPRWLWALLGALLLALLLCWLLDCCGGKKVETVSPATSIVAPATSAVVADSVTELKSEVVPVSDSISCNCANSDEPVLKNYSYEPKTLTALGSNPEFGNSHALSPAQFYDKLKNAHATSSVDKAFLDRIFKAMGYENGFSDATPTLFTDTVVPFGTVGNIGYSKEHKTQYSRLNLSETDQKAFRIKAKNGCDIHFMKTCGNHMFFCTK